MTLKEDTETGKRNERWMISLIEGLDKHVDKDTRAKVLEQCGRTCQSQSFVRKAKNIYEKSSNIDDFLDRLRQVYKHLHLEGENVFIIYPRCYCSQVNKIPKGKLSATYCECSKGWIKALFEGATGKPVEVITKETVVRGDKQCKFQIILRSV